MGVDLRVEHPAGVVSEVGDEDALGVEGPDLPVDPVAGVGVIVDPVDHRCHRCHR